MARVAFTRAEAQAKVGRRVRSRMAGAGVPAGVLGTITSAERVIDGYDVEVAWEGGRRHAPCIDWFTKGEYEACLMELLESRACPPTTAEDGQVQMAHTPFAARRRRV
jgi:hypothetical protein